MSRGAAPWQYNWGQKIVLHTLVFSSARLHNPWRPVSFVLSCTECQLHDMSVTIDTKQLTEHNDVQL